MGITDIVNKPEQYAGTGTRGKLTPQLQDVICSYISKGNYLVTACQAAGIDSATFRNWIERGQAALDAGKDRDIYFRFLAAVKKAEAQSEIKLVEAVDSHNSTTPIAPLALLDRRFRERWGQTPAVASGGNTYNFNIDKAVINASKKFDELMKRYEEPAEELAIPQTTEEKL